MSREFKIEKDYYCCKETIFKKDKITIEPNLTVLVGCNGSGKSTMINSIKYQLEKNNIKFICFNNLIEGGHNAVSSAGYRGDTDLMASLLISSEGENILSNIGTTVQKIGSFLRRNYDINEYWILLDAIDSGLSIDGIADVKEVFNLIINDNKNKNIYIVVAANGYELVRNANCFDVTNCEYIKFKDYEDYRDFILKSRKYKDKRYGRNKKKND